MYEQNRPIKVGLLTLALALQIAVVIGLPVIWGIQCHAGKIIVVRVVPVDPRSLFRGDYLQLGYTFSQINLGEVKHKRKRFWRGQRVFVRLVKAKKGWNAVEISTQPFRALSPKEVMLRWVVEDYSGNKLTVSYGLESYFIPEDKGRFLERQIWKRRVSVSLSVDKQGRAFLRDLFVNGEKVRFK